MRDLRKRRQQLGLTLREVARRAKVTPAFLCDLELGRRSAKRETLKRLAIPLKAEVGDFTHRCQGCDGTGYKVRPGLTWND